jgi:pseudouridine synthase, RluA family
MNRKNFEVEEYTGQRLDAVLANFLPEYSRTILQRWIKEGKVLVSGKIAKAGQKVEIGQSIEVEIPEVQESGIVAQDLAVPILFEDGDLVVVNKPRGLVVHPAAGHWEGTLVNSLLAQCGDLSGIGGEVRPGIVHRLDKDTSGVLVAAKNDFSHHFLSEQIRTREAKRNYYAIVQGEIAESQGRIEAPIGRHPKDRKKMAVLSQGGKESITEFSVVERFAGYTLVECQLVTGRTHQIRVHFSYIGFPVVGDPLYGTKKQKFSIQGQALHAHRLSFRHPKADRLIVCEAPMPEDMNEILEILRKGEEG